MAANTSKRWRIVVNAKVRSRRPLLPQARRVAEMFGLTGPRVLTLYEDFELCIRPGQIVAVVGPSGAGKSVLLAKVLRAVRSAVPLATDRLSRSDRPALACLRGGSLSRRLEMLCRCGLAEAMSMISPARSLSGGQLYRLALARALHEAGIRERATLVVADEFAATLDAQTAELLCGQVRKLIAPAGRLALLVATPRAELLQWLRPDQVVVKPLGVAAEVVQPAWPGPSAAATEDWAIERGSIGDYRRLAQFHYVAGPPAAHKRVYVIRPRASGGESPQVCLSPAVAAVAVVSPPVAAVRGRNFATAGRYVSADRRAAMARLNREVECISRVVVHPAFRGCGLAVRLVRHALLDAGAPLMESLAAMGSLHPLFAKAGMRCFGRFRGASVSYVYYLGRTAFGRDAREAE